MDHPLIHDRGRGPEIVGTRITVYNLFPDFLDPAKSEAELCRCYDLTPEQVAAARAYILHNLDTVLPQHLRIEARNAAGNTPEALEKIRTARLPLAEFKAWLDRRRAAEAEDSSAEPRAGGGDRRTELLLNYREWIAEREVRKTQEL